MKIYIRTFLLLSSCFVLFSGCSNKQVPPSLVAAESSYKQATQNSDVARYSPVPLQEANTYLLKAQKAKKDNQINHYAYLAQRKIEIAELNAQFQKELSSLEYDKNKKEIESAAMEKNAQEIKALREQLGELQAKQTKRGLQITLSETLFETGKADLKAGSKKSLDRLVTVLNENPNMKAVIEGHTDSSGSDQLNLVLSQRRSETVASYFFEKGIDRSRLVAKGYGKNFPIASNNNAAGRQQNRRVEIVLVPEGVAVSEAVR